MRIFLLIIFLLISASQLKAQLPYAIKVDRGRIWVEKYKLGSQPIFNDEERTEIISKAIDTGTGTIKVSDFILVSVSTHVLKIVEEMNNAGQIGGSWDTIKKIEERMSSEYNLKKLAENESFLSGYSILKDKGFVVSPQEDKLKNEIDECRGRLNNPIK